MVIKIKKNRQNELMFEIYSKSLVRAIGKILLIELRLLAIFSYLIFD